MKLPRSSRCPKLSVVVPTLNEEGEIEDCLASLARQSFSEFELIVVDNGSTDATGRVAQAFGARVIRLEERGVARARQAGFELAQGDIIASTDADGVVPGNWLESLTSPFQNSEVVGTFGTVHLSGGGIWAGLAQSFFPLFQNVNLLLGRLMFSGQNFAVRKGAFLGVGGFATRGSYPKVAEDVRLALKLKREGRITFLRDLAVKTSARRFQGVRALRCIGYHAGVYLKLCWLGGCYQPAQRGEPR